FTRSMFRYVVPVPPDFRNSPWLVNTGHEEPLLPKVSSIWLLNVPFVELVTEALLVMPTLPPTQFAVPALIRLRVSNTPAWMANPPTAGWLGPPVSVKVPPPQLNKPLTTMLSMPPRVAFPLPPGVLLSPSARPVRVTVAGLAVPPELKVT